MKITKSINSEEKELNRIKSEFISTASHEFRTPLTVVKEANMLLLDGVVGTLTDKQKHILNIAKRNINKLTNLLNDMLDLSKIDTGKMRLKKELCDINLIIKKSVLSTQNLAKEKKIILDYKLEKNLPKVVIDSARIYQVLINLIDNAIKFTENNGSIKINASCVSNNNNKMPLNIKKNLLIKNKKFILISVKDTGIGIDKKDFHRLFQRFGRLDGSLTREFGGSGLGLSICKKLIQMHEGYIWVESEISKGSVFNFILPV